MESKRENVGRACALRTLSSEHDQSSASQISGRHVQTCHLLMGVNLLLREETAVNILAAEFIAEILSLIS